MIEDLSSASYKELLQEWEECQDLWSKWSCDCFGFYIKALHKEIVNRGGWPSASTTGRLRKIKNLV